MSNDNVTLNTSGTNAANFVVNVDGATTTPVTNAKATTSKDTTSKATNTDTGTDTGINAGSPVLPDPSEMTDAQLMFLINSALGEANKQRRITQQTQQDPTYIASYVVTQVPVSPTNASTDGDSTTSADASTSDSGADVSASKSSSSDQTTTQKTAQDPASTMTVIGETQVQTLLGSTLSDAVNDRLEKHLQKRLPHLTMDAVSNFLNTIVTTGMKLVLPALGALSQSGKVFRTDKTGVDTSSAVTYGLNVLNEVQTGKVKSFASDQLKNNPDIQPSQLATVLETVLIQSATIQVGNASGLPGLGNQVNIQASVLRDQQTALKTQGPNLVTAALNSAVLPEGVTPAQLADKVNQALTDTVAQGPFNSRTDLLAALSKQVKQQVPDDTATADAIVTALDQESSSAVTAGSLIYVPKFDATQINKETFGDSVKQAILVAFAKSQEEVNNASKAKARADEISDAVLSKSYKSETEFRDAVSAEIKSNLADQDVTDEQVHQIVAGLNIPADPADPLFDANSTAVIPPALYSSVVQNDYQKTAQISPTSDLGQGYNLIAGIQNEKSPTGAIGLMNQAYAAANTETRSTMPFLPEEAAKIVKFGFTENATLLEQLGTLMNGTLPADYQQARFV